MQSYCALRRDVPVAQKALLRRQEDCIDAIAASSREAFPLPGTFRDQWERAVGRTPVHLVVTIVEERRLYVLTRAPGEGGYRARGVPVTREHLQQMAHTLDAAWEESARVKTLRDAPERERVLAASEERLRSGVLRELYDLVFGGFDAPPIGATIAFINDRILRDVPMAALHDGTRYLGERYAAVQVTPTSVVAAGSSNSTGKSLVMGVSEPDLPHVRDEIAAVARALETVGHLNQESTRARLVDWLEQLNGDALALHVGLRTPGSAARRLRLASGYGEARHSAASTWTSCAMHCSTFGSWRSAPAEAPPRDRVKWS